MGNSQRQLEINRREEGIREALDVKVAWKAVVEVWGRQDTPGWTLYSTSTFPFEFSSIECISITILPILITTLIIPPPLTTKILFLPSSVLQ